MKGIKPYKFLDAGISLSDLRERLSIQEGFDLSQPDVRKLLNEAGVTPTQILKPIPELDYYLSLHGHKNNNDYSAPHNYLISKDDLIKLESYHGYEVKVEKNRVVGLSKRERPKAIEIIEALKALNDTYPNTDNGDLLGQMKTLIVQYYGVEPTLKELKCDLELNGLSVSRKVLGKYLSKAFYS